MGIAVRTCSWGTLGRGGGRGHAPPHWCSRPAGATRRRKGPLRREQPPPPPRSRGREQWGAGGGAAGRLGGLCPAVPGVPGEQRASYPRLSPAVARVRLERVPRPGPRATGGCGVGCRDAGCGDAEFRDAECRDSSSRCGMLRWMEGAGWSRDRGFLRGGVPGGKRAAGRYVPARWHLPVGPPEPGIWGPCATRSP